jgi:hypothetical protein
MGNKKGDGVDLLRFFMNSLCYDSCMPRKARIDAAAALQHIICRGIERHKIIKKRFQVSVLSPHHSVLIPQSVCFASRLKEPLLKRLVGSSCPVVARRAESEARRAKPKVLLKRSALQGPQDSSVFFKPQSSVLILLHVAIVMISTKSQIHCFDTG